MEERKNINKVYDPKEVENNLYKRWEERGYFRPEVNPQGKPILSLCPT